MSNTNSDAAKKLKWCRENAPEQFKCLSDEDLMAVMDREWRKAVANGDASVTYTPEQLEWCRANALDAFQDLTDSELLILMERAWRSHCNEQQK